jgi:hypothetical protein
MMWLYRTGRIERNITDTSQINDSSSHPNKYYFHGKDSIVHYEPIQGIPSPQPGADIILYYSLNEKKEKLYAHSGVVYGKKNDRFMVRSKWAELGLYGHEIFDAPKEYGPFFDILHSENGRFLDIDQSTT